MNTLNNSCNNQPDKELLKQIRRVQSSERAKDFRVWSKEKRRVEI